jgi:hypothetical protein
MWGYFTFWHTSVLGAFVPDFIQGVRFEVFTVVTMKNAVFWDVAPCRSCGNQHFGGAYRLHLQGRKSHEQGTSVSGWLQTHAGFSLTDIPAVKMEAICSSETSIHTRSTWRHIPQDSILYTGWSILSVTQAHITIDVCVLLSTLSVFELGNIRHQRISL